MIKEMEHVLLNVFLELGYKEEYVKVSISNRPELCDFQINTVFTIAKELHKNPIEVGEELVNKINEIDNFSDYFNKVEFCKPGFINITVSDKLINKELNRVINEGDITKINSDITVILDYGGPNMAKALHVGHLRTAVIGQSMRNIFNKKGYKAIGDVHLGDMGLQMGQVIYGIKKKNINVEDITIEVLNDIYPGVSKLVKNDEIALNECRVLTNKLQKLLVDPTLEDNEDILSIYNKLYEVSINDIKRIYKYLGVDFDLWYGEKDSLKYMKPLMELFESKGLVEEDNGAKIVRVAKEDDNKVVPPAMLEVSSGAQGYQASDLATIYERVEDFHPDYILYFVDGRQALHFEQVFRASKLCGLTSGVILEHDYNGTINGSDGKPFKTRSGDTVKLDSLFTDVKSTFLSKKETNKDMSEEDLDKITRAIINFAELQNNREKNYIFDINKFSDVQGKTGPYILYTALRIRKILNDNEITNNKVSDKIYNEIDRDLRMKLLDVNDVVTKACDDRMPHYIAEYLYDLCVIVNSFYQNNNIKNITDTDNKNDWLNILKQSYKVIEELLDLLSIEIPSKM